MKSLILVLAMVGVAFAAEVQKHSAKEKAAFEAGREYGFWQARNLTAAFMDKEQTKLPKELDAWKDLIEDTK